MYQKEKCQLFTFRWDVSNFYKVNKYFLLYSDKPILLTRMKVNE
jgi:hypothetical protein